ncbi:MAG: hypothetical protein HY863_19855 [Chloroflexi bacterium]|nr:hypothetical protein [Chloroflexota bacterium]
MNRRYVRLIIAEALIIMLLLIGVAVMFVLLNKSAPIPTLPTVPTFDPKFSTTTPHPFTFPTLSTNTFLPDSSPQAATPSPTATSTVIPVSSNNSVSVSTLTPTLFFAPTWTFSPTPSATARLSQTCRNILYPVVTGQQWLYQANALNRTDTLNMSVLSVNNSQGNVLISNQTTGSSKQVPVQCDGDVIRSFPFMSVNALFFGDLVNSSLTASYASGVLAPNEAAFLNTNWALAWSSQYLVSGSTTVSRNGRQIDVTMNNSPITLTCQTLATGDAAFESVTVPAGTFRALKVVCTEQGQVTATVDGITVTGLAEGRSNQWFALNTGLVKMQVESATVNFFGVSFSVLTANSFELKSYTAAP